MTWVKLDDGFWSHPKVDGTSLAAVGVFARSLSYCGAHLTDGSITPEAAIYMAAGKKALLAELVDRGLWEQLDGGYRIPDFLDFNPSREQVEAERQKSAERQAKFQRRSRRD